jgi:tetratricopeptide (TPR) repeat protein
MLSQARFDVGDMDQALSHGRNALTLCEKAGDLDGICAYLNSLHDIRRYQGDSAEAANLADRLSEVLAQRQDPVGAKEWSRAARRYREGEPLCRIVIVVGDRAYEVEDVPRVVDQTVRFEFRRNRLALGCCNERVQRGMEEGSRGRAPEAWQYFQEAAALDPFDPSPHYQAAVALMTLERPERAVEELRRTEELAPGWFQCRSDLWLAEQVASGSLPYAAYSALRALQDHQPTSELLSLAELSTRKCDIALLHHQHGRILGALGRPADAARAHRKGLSLPSDPDLRTRLLVSLASVIEAGDDRRRLLREASELRGNLVAAAQASFLLRCEA